MDLLKLMKNNELKGKAETREGIPTRRRQIFNFFMALLITAVPVSSLSIFRNMNYASGDDFAAQVNDLGLSLIPGAYWFIAFAVALWFTATGRWIKALGTWTGIIIGSVFLFPRWYVS
jgi:hypothetical protein